MPKFKNIAACVIGVSLSEKNGEIELVAPGKTIECLERDVSYLVANDRFEAVEKPKAEKKAA